jgi:hypothetical protein
LRISVITAVKSGMADHLGALHDSLQRQAMPPGWEWQWVLQEDGETGEPASMLPRDRRISAGMAPWGGAARARTLALSRADGDLIRAVDADDVLTDGALLRDITVLTRYAELGWCVSPAMDLLEDGSTRPGPRDPAPGLLPPGLLDEGERAGLMPVLGVTMCAHAALICTLGGWPPHHAAEDSGLLLAAAAVAPGWMHAEPGLLYRRWPKATCYGLDKQVASTATPDRAVMLAHAAALRAAGWRWTAKSLPSWEA